MTVITRAQAGLPPVRATPVAPHRKTMTVLHHTVTPMWVGVQAARNLDRIGRSRGHGGTSYPWASDRQGNEVEGRGWHVVGAHTRGHNVEAEAVALVANCDVVPPPAAMVAGAARLARQSRPGRISHSHRDLVATACPGRYGVAAIPAINAAPDPVEDDVRWTLIRSPDGRIWATSKWRAVAERGAPRVIVHGRQAWHVRTGGVLEQLLDAGQLVPGEPIEVAEHTAAALSRGDAVHIGPVVLTEMRDRGLLASPHVPEVDTPVVEAILTGGTQ